MKVFALLLAAAAPLAAQPALVELIPPQSKVVFGVNLRHIIVSAQLPDLETAGKAISLQMLAQNGLPGLNPLKDVDSIVVASTGEGTEPPTVAMLWGRFGSLKIGERKDPKGSIVRVSDSLLVVGDSVMVEAVIGHAGGPLPPALAERVAALSARYDVWGTGGKPGGFVAAKGQGDGLEGVDRFEFGASFQKGLDLVGEIHVKSAEDARKLSDSLKFFEMITKAQPASTNGSKFNLSTSNGTLKLAMYIPEEELKKAIAKQKASMAAVQPKPKVETEVKITKAPNGDTMTVTLPGGH